MKQKIHRKVNELKALLFIAKLSPTQWFFRIIIVSMVCYSNPNTHFQTVYLFNTFSILWCWLKISSKWLSFKRCCRTLCSLTSLKRSSAWRTLVHLLNLSEHNVNLEYKWHAYKIVVRPLSPILSQDWVKHQNLMGHKTTPSKCFYDFEVVFCAKCVIFAVTGIVYLLIFKDVFFLMLI